jgi:hypothetical protein
VLAAGCLSNDIGSSSFGVVQGSPEVKFARTTTGITSYGGIGYYQWNIILATTEGCAGDIAATFEINTPVVGAPNAYPLGTIPVRADQIPVALPSALATFDVATGVSGNVIVEQVDTFEVRGSFDATLTSGPMVGTFIAFRCDDM